MQGVLFAAGVEGQDLSAVLRVAADELVQIGKERQVARQAVGERVGVISSRSARERLSDKVREAVAQHGSLERAGLGAGGRRLQDLLAAIRERDGEAAAHRALACCWLALDLAWGDLTRAAELLPLAQELLDGALATRPCNDAGK